MQTNYVRVRLECRTRRQDLTLCVPVGIASAWRGSTSLLRPGCVFARRQFLADYVVDRAGRASGSAADRAYG